MTSAPRRILLVDCDTFFVQVARLEDPEGAGRALLLIVGGSPSGRGVVTSADYAVRRFGVHSGMPTAQALRLCPEARVVPVPRAACLERSRAVRRELERVAPLVEAASIDEFYLDLTGMERLFGEEKMEESALRIRESVLRETGISVSIGGGSNRLVAKLAVARAKPAGVHIVPAGQEAAFLRTVPPGEIPGIGPALLDELTRRGLSTVEDILGIQEEWLTRWFGTERAAWLRRRALGVDPTPVQPGRPRKSISAERTFPKDLTEDAALETRLQRLSLEVGKALRDRELTARTVTVKLRTSDFRTRQSARTLEVSVTTDRAIDRTARELLRDLRVRERGPVRLLGVALGSLQPRNTQSAGRQLSLLDSASEEESERDIQLSHATDELRRRFGDDAILPARTLDVPGSARHPQEPPSTGPGRHDS
ncbi:MAG: DNA polymerase IV [Gemmatimonadota bacterium]